MSPRGVTASLALAGLLAAPAIATADYRTPRILGDRPWEPDLVRVDEAVVSLSPRPKGRLRGPDKVRESAEVDLESGVVVVRRKYGKVLVGPEWVEDIRDASLAAGRRAAHADWVDRLRRSSLTPDAARSQALSIELPVDLPESIANVIGQGARLNLTGSERITFSGTSRITKGGPTFESGSPSAFPDLDMKQQLRVNLDGTIGEKIHVLVNHDSEVDIELENKIRLRYDGNEDEVIQKIEMGNTALALPGSEFLSFRKSQQGLFGAKTEAKLGPLDLTVIASKQEGKTASQRFVGRARRDSVVIRDVEYVKRKYYWAVQPLLLATPGVAFEGFELFLDDKDTRNDIAEGAQLGFALTDGAGGSADDSTGVNRGFFHRLDVNVDYTWNAETGGLILQRPLARDQALAAFFRFSSADTSYTSGSLDNPDTLLLQLIAPPERDLYDDAKGFRPLRDLELKNVYFLGAQNIRPESFQMRVLRKASAAGEQDEEVQESDQLENLEFLRILGLDHKGLTDPTPDLVVEPEFVDFEDGTITFPNLTPFAPDSSTLNVIVSRAEVATGRSPGVDPAPGVPLLEYNSALYELEPDDLVREDKYLLEVKYTTPTPTYSLNRFNILEGSERVSLNGRLLTRGTDYDIDYDFGVLTFRTADASLPDAEIEVDFEFVPLFGQAKESLLGMSGTYNFGPRTSLSSSWLFFTRATPEDRPKLGQEPSRILVGNVYGQWAANPNFMTGIVNALPLVRSSADSELQLQGEVGMSVPNPNTKNEIYIDDMEGVEDSREFSITRGVWSPASEPAGPDDRGEGLDRTGIRPLPHNWYNPENVVRRRQIFAELDSTREGDEFVQVLEFGIRPDAAVDTTDPDSTGWFGIMRNLSPIGENFSEKKFLEVWVNDFGGNRGNLIVDLGEISEDFYVRAPADSTAKKGRGFLDTEDVDPYDGELTVSREDFGLDNVAGADDAAVAGDDGDDDFDFRRSDPVSVRFRKINNYEGNSLLDTEDLDGDNFLDDDDAYVSYVVDLSDTTLNRSGPLGLGEGYLAIKNHEPTARPDNHWRLYRVPLDDGIAVGGVPRLRSVKYARVWFDGLAPGAGVKAQIFSVKIVGAAWLEEKLSTNDTGEPLPLGSTRGNLRVNVANNKEDGFYFTPPGIRLRRDINEEVEREQTLVMLYDDIPSRRAQTQGELPPRQLHAAGLQGSAYREILDTGQGKNQDFTQYSSLSLFLRDGALNADGSLRLAEPSSGTFFFRFGPDTTNYYELSTTQLTSGPGGWREVFIDLQALSELKLDPPTRTVVVEGREVEYRSTVVDGDTLAVFGAPSLARVRRMTIGVKGDDPGRQTVRGEIWVNDIRLRSVKKDVGYASRATGRARFSDFLTADGSVRKIDSEFRRIEGDRHGRNEFSWNARGDVKLHKFFEGVGLSIPLTGDYSYSESTPRLAPNSDVELVRQEDKLEAQSTTRRSSLSSRISKTQPSRSPILRYSIDNMSFSGSRAKTRQRTPFVASADQVNAGQATYNLTPGQGKFFVVRGFQVSYFPALQLGLNGRQSVRESADIRRNPLGERFEDPRDPVRTRTVEGTMGVQWDPLRTATLDTQFGFHKAQDLDLRKELALFESLKQGGREVRRDHNARVSWRPGFLRWLRPVLSYNTTYLEDQGPSVQAGDTPERLRRVENRNTREISTSLNPRSIFKASRPARAPARRPSRRPARDPAGQGTAPGEEEPPQDGQPGTPPGPAPDVPPGSAPPEDAGENEEPEQEVSGPGLAGLWHAFSGFARTFGDIRYTYRDDRSGRFSRAGGRPGLGFQFGLEDFDRSLLVPGTSLIDDNTSNSYSSKLETSFRPSGAFYMDTSYQRTITRTVRNNIRNKNLTISFPSLSVNIDGLEKWRMFRRWAKTSSLNGSFRRETTRSGTLPPPDMPDPPDVDWFDREAVRRDFAPLLSWSTAWNSGVNTTLTVNRGRATDRTEFNNIASATETTTSEMRLTGRYSFDAPRGISLLGRRIRFRSALTLTFDVTRGENKVRESRSQLGGPTTTNTRSHQKSLRVGPRASYNFSQKVQGSLSVNYGSTKDLQRDRTEKTISVAVEAVINF